MNVNRIALFFFIVQVSVTLVSLAGIPLRCLPNDPSTCIRFTTNTMSSTSISEIVTNEIQNGQYTSSKVQTDITTDAFQSTSQALGIFTEIIAGNLTMVYHLIIFIFGTSSYAVTLALSMQSICYMIYLIAAANWIRGLDPNI